MVIPLLAAYRRTVDCVEVIISIFLHFLQYSMYNYAVYWPTGVINYVFAFIFAVLLPISVIGQG